MDFHCYFQFIFILPLWEPSYEGCLPVNSQQTKGEITEH